MTVRGIYIAPNVRALEMPEVSADHLEKRYAHSKKISQPLKSNTTFNIDETAGATIRVYSNILYKSLQP